MQRKRWTLTACSTLRPWSVQLTRSPTLDIYKKMCAIFESQARSLCALPKEECATGHCAVLSDNTCASILTQRLTAEAQNRAQDGGAAATAADGSTKSWKLEYRPEVRVSTNVATEFGGFFHTYDLWRLGFDSIKDQFISGIPQMKEMAEKFDKIRNMR